MGYSQDNKLYNYVQYLANRDVSIKKTIGFQDFNHENAMGFGLQAGQFIESGLTIFEVPYAGVLSGKNWYMSQPGN